MVAPSSQAFGTTGLRNWYELAGEPDRQTACRDYFSRCPCSWPLRVLAGFLVIGRRRNRRRVHITPSRSITPGVRFVENRATSGAGREARFLRAGARLVTEFAQGQITTF
jgi:hypothetical protein